MALVHIRLECSCGGSSILSAIILRKYLNGDLNVTAVMELAPRFRCQNCKARGDAHIYDDKDRLLYDPERTKHCAACDALIPFARIELNPQTNVCTACAQEGAQPQQATPYPQPPADMKTCAKCGAATAMYQNTKFKNWFVGCSTYPKCHWSRWR
jgi:hypothetical protein